MTRCNFIMSSSAPNWITMIRTFCAAILYLHSCLSHLCKSESITITHDLASYIFPTKIWIENADCSIKMFQQRDFVISRPAISRKHWQTRVKMNQSSSTAQVCKLNYSRLSEKRGKECSRLKTFQSECQKIKRWTNTLARRWSWSWFIGEARKLRVMLDKECRIRIQFGRTLETET